MKILFAALCLCLLSLATHAQGSWPRNAKTGKVEFTGVLPWPASVKTEAQRRALVRRWYLARLTDSTTEEVAADAGTVVSKSLLTYAELPVNTSLETGQPLEGYSVMYEAHLASSKTGLSYTFSQFMFAQRKDSESRSLETLLAATNPNEKAALAALRGRLARAVAGWN